MFSEIEKLSKNQLTRDLQLRVFMSIDAISHLVLDAPADLDLARLEKRLIDDYHFILGNLFSRDKQPSNLSSF